MRWLIVLLAWITPAVVAGILGWSGIWGGGSAVSDFLIPIPVAGGALHVPSFLIAAALILTLDRQPSAGGRAIMLLAMGVFITVMTLQIDFDRLNEALFTDYDPHGSPVRFDGNPLYLFIITDAFWVAFGAWLQGNRGRPRDAAVLAIIPATIVGGMLLRYSVGDPKLTYGFTQSTGERGNEIAFVHTSGDYDEELFRHWLEETGIVRLPWQSQNAENLAVFFTNSMQNIRWGKSESRDGIVGTLCFFEADQSSLANVGYFDCFADRVTLNQRLNQSLDETDTGLGRELDRWFAMARLCEGVSIPDEYDGVDIELIDLCRSLKRRFPELLDSLRTQYGESSPQVEFAVSNARLISAGSSDPSN